MTEQRTFFSRLHMLFLAAKMTAQELPSLRTPGTMLTTMVLLPLLEVVLLIAVAGTFQQPHTTTVALAGLSMSCASSIIGGVVGAITRDRGNEVMLAIFGGAGNKIVYWASKILVVVAIAVATTFVASLAVLILAQQLQMLPVVLAVLATHTLAGIALGFVAGSFALYRANPYGLSNAVIAALPITAGVVAPLAAYPVLFQPLLWCLPGTAGAQALWAWTAGQPHMLLLLQECLVSGLWFILAVILIRRAQRVLYSGSVSTEIF